MGVVLWLARSLTSFVLGSLIFSSFMVLLLVNNISSKLFSPEFYTESISEQDAYNRIYDEVLVDHIFQGTTQELFEGLGAELRNPVSFFHFTQAKPRSRSEGVIIG